MPSSPQHAHVHVYVVTTSASRQFFDVDLVQAMDKRAASFSTRDLAAMNATGAHSGNYDAPRVRVWGEEDEWSAWTALGDPVLHIEVSFVCVLTCAAAPVGRCGASGAMQCKHAGEAGTWPVRQCPSTRKAHGPFDTDLTYARAFSHNADVAFPGDEHAHVHAPADGAPAAHRARARLRSTWSHRETSCVW